MKMKKSVLVCLFLIFLFPTSNALSSPVNFSWAVLFSSHGKNIDGTTYYNMLASVGVDCDSVTVTLDFPDKGTQIKLDLWGPYVWDPTYYEYYKSIYSPPPGDWYETSYRFLVDDGTSSPLFSHATNNIFPMDFVQADISGGKHPTITWEPVDFADRYQIRFFDIVTGERLFEESIDEDGSTSYSYTYLGNLFEEHEKLRIRISARDYDNDQIVNRSTVSYEHSADDGVVTPLRLLTPNGGEIIPSGSGYTIEWGAPPEAETFKLRFSPDNGANWELIQEELTGTSYESEVPTFTKNMTNCLIKVVGYDASGAKVGADTSDETFTIAVLAVTSPNGGEVVPSGDTYDITWQTNGTESEVDSVELFYSRDGGTTWKLIEEALIGNPGTYEWTVPGQKKNLKNCLVKVKALDVSGNKVAVDKSDATFTIAVLEVTSPNGGETLTSGDIHTITWTTNETKAEVTKVKLFYTQNGGDRWIKIDTLTGGGPGTYDWTVPSVNNVKTECRVKVELKDAQGNIVGKATSDSYFTIFP